MTDLARRIAEEIFDPSMPDYWKWRKVTESIINRHLAADEQERAERDAKIRTTLEARIEELETVLSVAVTMLRSAADEQRPRANQSGPEFWESEALLLEDVLAEVRDED